MDRHTLRMAALRVLALPLGRGAALLAILGLALPIPMNDDNAYWHGMAFELLHAGRWPYLQYWDHSFPGPLLIHVPIVYLFGTSDVAFRAVDVLIQLFFCCILYRLWRLWLSDRMAWIAVLLYAFSYVRGTLVVGGEKDVYGMIFVISGVYLLLKRREGTRLPSEVAATTSQNSGSLRDPSKGSLSGIVLTAAGLLVGLAVLIKPTYLLFLFPLIVFQPELRGVRQISILLVSALLPLLVSFGIYVLRPGGLDAYWTATVTFNKDVYATISRPFLGFFRGLSSPKVFAIPLVVGLVVLLSGRRFPSERALSRKDRALYFASVILALAIVLLQRKFFTYHFTMVIVLLTPIAALGMESVLDSTVLRRLLPPRVVHVLIFAGLWMLSLQFGTFLDRFRERAPSEGWVQALPASFLAIFQPRIPVEKPTLDYFSQPERLHATVEVASFDPRLRLGLARAGGGKYPTLEALGYRTDLKDPHAFTSYQRVWRREYLDSLRVLHPDYLVISRKPRAEYLQDPYADVLHNLEGFDSLLQTNYRLDTIIESNDIYRSIPK